MLCYFIQGDHKSILLSRNDTGNKCSILRTFTPTRVDARVFKVLYSPHRDSKCARRVTLQTIIRLVPNFLRSFSSDGRYSSCDSLSQLRQRLRQRRDTHCLVYSPTRRSCTGLSLAILAAVFTSLAPMRPIRLRGRWSRTAMLKSRGAPACWKAKSVEVSPVGAEVIRQTRVSKSCPWRCFKRKRRDHKPSPLTWYRTYLFFANNFLHEDFWSPNTTIMLIYLTVDVESCPVTKSESCGKVVYGTG
jgi:hypothetical protein